MKIVTKRVDEGRFLQQLLDQILGVSLLENCYQKGRFLLTGASTRPEARGLGGFIAFAFLRSLRLLLRLRLRLRIAFAFTRH